MDALSDNTQARAVLAKRKGTNAPGLDDSVNALSGDWQRLMLKGKGERTGIAFLHPHRFRSTYAFNVLRAKITERRSMLHGG